MKFSCFFIAAVASADVAPPTISLNLEGMGRLTKTKARYAHDLGYTQPNGAPVGARQDYTETCPAGTANGRNCPLPTAGAYDHHDGKLRVTRRIILVDDNNKSVSKQVKKIDYSKRSMYMIKYDAKDKSGNHAEQVVFVLTLDDTVRPVIVPCAKNTVTVEAATKWSLCRNTVTSDNIDSSSAVLKTMTYTVSHEAGNFEKDANLMCNKCTYAQAAAKITTLLTGTFTVRLEAHDHAGKYGKNSKDNTAMNTMTVVVRDTTKPVITVQGAQPATHECATQYSDTGATSKDSLDDKLSRPIIVRTTNPVNSAKIGSYTVAYNGKDSHANAAITKTRGVNVVDVTKPVIKRVGAKTIEHVSEGTFVDAGATCMDSCDIKNVKITKRWKGKKFTDKDIGDYVQVYKCTDQSGNKKYTTRTWTVVDKKAPIITVSGADSMVLEASTTAVYTDGGATCHDYVDENLNKKVKVTGDLVDYRTPGTYTIKYDCKDLSHNQAIQMTRKVVIVDTTCPTVAIKGASVLEIEAGYPYKDAGAKASDTLDGVITSKITTSGDTVNTRKAFYAFRSCKAIQKNDKKAKSGQYFITTTVAGKLARKSVWCDMKYQQTYFQCNNCPRVRPYGKSNGGCSKHGMVMARPGANAKAAAIRHFKKAGEENSRYFPADKRATSNFYLCGPKKLPFRFRDSFTPKHGDISHAEQGKYIINFHVADKAGNKECVTRHRTVVVKDTLPPVITLHLGRKMIHMSDATKKGIAGRKNFAGIKKYNPFFMAEAQTVNGWIIAAVGAAGVGVALLGFAGRKAAVVEVPV